jgi:hypothetical protein
MLTRSWNSGISDAGSHNLQKQVAVEPKFRVERLLRESNR